MESILKVCLAGVQQSDVHLSGLSDVGILESPQSAVICRSFKHAMALRDILSRYLQLKCMAMKCYR
jgi:hypothetical protein